MQSKSTINWFGLAGGASTLGLTVASLFVPWWVLTVGQGLVKANVSPMYTNFNLIGNAFTVPLLVALNIASILFMTAGGIAMLIYSIKPTRPYSKRLLGFGYTKPLISVLLFLGVLIALQQIIKIMVNLDIPLYGSATSVLPHSTTYGAIVTVLISTNFQWPFYLAATAAGLCIAARFYHKKIIPMSTQTQTVTANMTAPVTPASA
jgi:hypothetical protein